MSLVTLAYFIGAALFVLSLKWMNTPVTARRSVWAGVIAMLAAIIGTLLMPQVVNYKPIFYAIAAGVVVGIPISMVSLTAVPQRTAISHAFGALAAALVGTAEYYLEVPHLERFKMGAIVFEVMLGSLTATGSVMAFLKLQEWIPTRPITFKYQNFINLGLLAIAIIIGVVLVYSPDTAGGPLILFPLLIALALAFGVLLIIPIGGADMPTVISLLNSYAGLAAVAMGFVLDNKLLIIAGALDGSSGLILSIIMCRAMNRSFVNVLFGAFGQVQAAAVSGEQKNYRSATPEDAASILENAGSVVIVPGYGMAVAQAQHKVRELYDALTKKGVEVSFAIHPVAGRMPGHMNVLLAEADIPYDKLREMDDINHDFPQTDVALVIGANDVTNPAARHDQSSPIYGMPILDVDKARNVMIIKRSMNPGFAGIDNELYYLDKSLMLFGDAKSFVGDIVKQLGSSGMH